jgi:ribosomal protein S12 methylthiotransferase accessory factor YcaO
VTASDLTTLRLRLADAFLIKDAERRRIAGLRDSLATAQQDGYSKHAANIRALIEIRERRFAEKTATHEAIWAEYRAAEIEARGGRSSLLAVRP